MIKKNTRRGASSGEVTKVILIFASIVSAIFVAVELIFFDGAEIREFLLQVGICLAVNLGLMYGVDAVEYFSKKRWEARNSAEFWGSDEYGMLKCSGFVYMLYLTGILMDLMMGVFFLQWYQSEPQTLMETYEEGGLNFPAAFLVFYNIVCVYYFLRYNRRRVFYNRYAVCITCWSKQEIIPWRQITQLEYHYKHEKKQKLSLVVGGQTYVLRSDILSDGWEDFIECMQWMAEEFGIPVSKSYGQGNRAA